MLPNHLLSMSTALPNPVRHEAEMTVTSLKGDFPRGFSSWLQYLGAEYRYLAGLGEHQGAHPGKGACSRKAPCPVHCEVQDSTQHGRSPALPG